MEMVPRHFRHQHNSSENNSVIVALKQSLHNNDVNVAENFNVNKFSKHPLCIHEIIVPNARLSRFLFSLVLFCGAITSSTAPFAAQSRQSNSDAKKQELILIQAQLQQKKGELAWNQSTQARTDIPREQKIELETQAQALAAEIAKLEARQRALQ